MWQFNLFGRRDPPASQATPRRVVAECRLEMLCCRVAQLVGPDSAESFVRNNVLSVSRTSMGNYTGTCQLHMDGQTAPVQMNFNLNFLLTFGRWDLSLRRGLLGAPIQGVRDGFEALYGALDKRCKNEVSSVQQLARQ